MAIASDRGTGARRHSIAVLSPAPILTVTIESVGNNTEVHLHPGGQGVWIARMITTFGVEPVLCATFGGESGAVVRGLLERWDIALRPVSAVGSNGTYIHDRRTGVRDPIVEVETGGRSRHEVDELYGAVLVAGLRSGVVVLGGPEPVQLAGARPGGAPELLPPEFYTRIASDLGRNGVRVLADLSGPFLEAAVRGGLDLVKVSDEDLRSSGHVSATTVEALVRAAQRLTAGGADAVVVTRAALPALVVTGHEVREVLVPTLEAIDPRGAGDSFTAGVAAALARGDELDDAIRLGTAAGALNVTRRGLGCGKRREIETLARYVTIHPLGGSNNP